MHAIEFEADIVDGVIRIPDNHKNIDGIHAKVIVLTQDEQGVIPFNPKVFFGAAHQTKKEVDAYLVRIRERYSQGQQDTG